MPARTWDSDQLFEARDEDDPQSAVGAWRKQAACWDIPPWTMFDPRPVAVRAALERCDVCPVLAQCREYALRYREPYGVWGGLTPVDRERILAGQPAREWHRGRGGRYRGGRRR